MTRDLTRQLLLAVVVAAAAAAAVWAQPPATATTSAAETSAPATATTPTAPASTAPPLGEDERLPFMQREDRPEMQEPSSAGMMARALGAMLLIVGLIFGAAWGLKKAGLAGFKKAAETDTPDLTVLSTISIASGRTISTVRFGEKALLVGSTAQSFTLLAESDGDAEKTPDRTERNPRSVAELLAAEEKSIEAPADFGAEFERAQLRLAALRDNGGKTA